MIHSFRRGFEPPKPPLRPPLMDGIPVNTQITWNLKITPTLVKSKLHELVRNTFFKFFPSKNSLYSKYYFKEYNVRGFRKHVRLVLKFTNHLSMIEFLSNIFLNLSCHILLCWCHRRKEDFLRLKPPQNVIKPHQTVKASKNICLHG